MWDVQFWQYQLYDGTYLMGLKNTFEKLSSKQSISRNQGLQLAKNTAAEWNVYIAFLSQLSKL